MPVFGGSCVCVMCGWVGVGGDGVGGCVCVVLIESCRICVQCVFGASLYAPGGCLVSGAALEPGMQHFVLTQKIMLHLVGFTVFFSPNQAGWWFGWVGAWLVVSSVLVLVNCGVCGR